MAQYHAQVIFPFFTGLPRDVAINTFNFRGSTGNTEAVQAITARLQNLYNVGEGASQTLASHMGLSISRASCRIKVYEVPTTFGPMGDPIEDLGWSLGAAGTGIYPLPMEVAVCCSMVGLDQGVGDTIPIRRRRGRFFLGPLNSLAIDTTLDNYPNVSNTTRTNLAAKAAVLQAANDEDATWCVWSRAGWEAGAGADAWQEVQSGWVDNEFDTQRRRELDPTARTAWGVPLP